MVRRVTAQLPEWQVSCLRAKRNDTTGHLGKQKGIYIYIKNAIKCTQTWPKLTSTLLTMLPSPPPYSTCGARTAESEDEEYAEVW